MESAYTSRISSKLKRGSKMPTDASSSAGSTIMAADVFVSPHWSQEKAMPDWEFWQTSSTPLVATGDPRVQSQVLAGNPDPASHLPLDQTFSMESDQFVGIGLMQIKGLGAQKDGHCRWLSRSTIQGRFKKRVSAADIWVGQENWNKQRLPSSFNKLVMTSAAKVFSSTCKVHYQYDPVHGVAFLNPLLAMARVVHVCPPGSVPPSLFDVPEDLTALGSHMMDKQGRPLSYSARQRYFDRLSNLEGQVLDEDHTYTFVIAQNVLDFASYKLTLGGWLNLDLCQLLNGQPLQMMLKNIKEDRNIVGLLMWHKNLNYRQGYGGGLSASSSSQSLFTSSSGSSIDHHSSGALSSSSGYDSSVQLQGSSSGSSGGYGGSSSSINSNSSSSSSIDAASTNSSGDQPGSGNTGACSSSTCGGCSACGEDVDDGCCCSVYGSACSEQFDVCEDVLALEGDYQGLFTAEHPGCPVVLSDAAAGQPTAARPAKQVPANGISGPPMLGLERAAAAAPAAALPSPAAAAAAPAAEDVEPSQHLAAAPQPQQQKQKKSRISKVKHLWAKHFKSSSKASSTSSKLRGSS